MERRILRESFGGLTAFFSVARERSFTRAAAQLGLTQTAVSHAVRGLEKALGAQLLLRTSRTVIPTKAGEHLLCKVGPALEEIDAAVSALERFRDSAAGSIRITAPDHAIRTILSPRVGNLLLNYPEIKVELFADSGFVDLAEHRFDAGVRLGNAIAQDMIAVRISADVRYTVVATKKYFASRQVPTSPRDLMGHNCIGLRLMTHGELWAWEFEQNGNPVNVAVQGQLIHNSVFDCLDSAVAGLGVAYVPEELAQPYVSAGHLIPVLRDWCSAWPGFHLYYPSRLQSSGAMALLIAELRYPD